MLIDSPSKGFMKESLGWKGYMRDRVWYEATILITLWGWNSYKGRIVTAISKPTSILLFFLWFK